MTVCAMFLARQFYDLQPSHALKYATLGVLFVNVSIGGTLTHFAAPPILMVARPWSWDVPFMMATFGVRAVLAIALSTACYALLFRREIRHLATRPLVADVERPEENGDGLVLVPVPPWVVAAHIGLLAWTVFTAQYPTFMIGGFLFFLGFARATAPYQSQVELKTPLMVGMFLACL